MTADTRERILHAARSLYLKRGEEGVTMRRVAATVGITATALYRHFENREAILQEVVSDGFRRFAGYLHGALAGRTPEERLTRSGAAYLRFATEHAEIYRTIFISRPAGASEADDRRDARRSATFQFLVDRVEECLASGFLRAGDPTEIAVTIWAHVHGLISLRIAGTLTGTEAEFRERYKESLTRIFQGLAARPPVSA